MRLEAPADRGSVPRVWCASARPRVDKFLKCEETCNVSSRSGAACELPWCPSLGLGYPISARGRTANLPGKTPTMLPHRTLIVCSLVLFPAVARAPSELRRRQHPTPARWTERFWSRLDPARRFPRQAATSWRSTKGEARSRPQHRSLEPAGAKAREHVADLTPAACFAP